METALAFTSKHPVSACDPHISVRCGDRAKVDGHTVNSRAQTRTHLPHLPQAHRRSTRGSLKVTL